MSVTSYDNDVLFFFFLKVSTQIFEVGSHLVNLTQISRQVRGVSCETLRFGFQ